MEKFLYMVSPRIPIRELNIRRETNIELDQEQVVMCLKHGPVYRKFLNQGKDVQVTLDNLDRLHNAVYMEEKEYLEKKSTAVEEVSVEEPEAETPVEAPVEEVPEEHTEVEAEAVTEETPATVEPEVEGSEEEVAEETVETAAEEVKAEEAAPVQATVNKNNGKNKNKR